MGEVTRALCQPAVSASCAALDGFDGCSVNSADAQQRTPLKLKEIAVDVRGPPTCFMKALAISIIVATLCSGMAVPASAMPNMPHLFASEVARCGGDVARASKHHRYRNSSRGYSGDVADC